MSGLSRNGRVFVILAVVLLAVNGYFLWRVSGSFKTFRQQTTASLQQLQQQVDNVSNQVNGLREQSRLISPMDVRANLENGEVTGALLSWEVKQLQDGADVCLYYRCTSDSEDFTKVVAGKGEDCTYTATIPLSRLETPSWEISWASNAGSSKAYRVDAQEISGPGLIDGGAQTVFEYYVSIRTGDTQQVTEKEISDLSKLMRNAYSPLQVQVNDDVRRDELDIALRVLPAPLGDGERVTSARLEAFTQGGSVAETIPMRYVAPESQEQEQAPAPSPSKISESEVYRAIGSIPGGVTTYAGTWEKASSSSSVAVCVEYADGQSFSTQIWPR